MMRGDEDVKVAGFCFRSARKDVREIARPALDRVEARIHWERDKARRARGDGI